MQIDRLGWAMRVAAEAMAEGDVRAIGPFIKAIDRLDRYQELARRTATRPNTSEADLAVIRSLVARIQGAGAPGHAVSADAPKSGGAGADSAAEREARPPLPVADGPPSETGAQPAFSGAVSL